MIIDIWSLPTRTIKLYMLSETKEIFQIMTGVTDYCYAFTHITGTMKFGQSDNNEWEKGSWGERIYRQAWHIPGWNIKCSPNMSGKEFLDTIAHYPNIHKDDVIVKIWDMTNYAFLSKDNHKFELTALENQLIEAYETMTGCTPIGNKQNLNFIKNKAVVSDSTLELFTFE